MSLDPMPSAEQLLRMKEERDGRAAVPRPVRFGAPEVIVPPPVLTRRSELEPITLRVPWSCLVSDNVKFRAGIQWRGDSATPRIVLTNEYRAARDRIKRLARDVMGERRAFAQPLSLEARVWVPNNQARDVVNFSKALHDAMQGVVYADDRWLFDVRWVRAGLDVDAPRCELTVSPILP